MEGRNNPSMEHGESQEHEGGYSRSTKWHNKKVHFHIDGHVSPQKCRVRTKNTEVQRQSRGPRWHCKRRLWSLCSFYRTGLVWVSQMTAAKVMDVLARLPDCDGQAADAVSAYTQVKLEDAARLLQFPKSECPDVWIRLPRHFWPKSWSSIEDPVVPWTKSVPTPTSLTRKFCWNLDGKKYRIENVFLFNEIKDYSYRFSGLHQNGFLEEIDEKRGSWRTHIILWTRMFGMCST